MNEYDFCEDEIDEHIQICSIPQSMMQSLRNSRITNHNYQSINQMILSENKYYVDSTNCSPRNELFMKTLGKSFKNQEKMKKIIQGQQKRMLSQCTFKPATNIKKTNKKDFNKFLIHQQAHVKKVQQKNRKMKQQLENKTEKITFQPKTNKSSKNISKQNVSVFDRLNNMKIKQKKNKFSNQNTFHPKINKKSQNLIRHQSVEQILYKDAQERKNRQNDIREGEKEQEKTQRKQTNYTSEQYVAQKFMKQYFNTLKELKVGVEENSQIQIEKFIQLLFKLRFLSPTEAISQQSAILQMKLANEMYQHVSEYFPNAKNIFVILLPIIGVYHIYPSNGQHSESLIPNKCNLSLNQSQGRSIHKKYNKLYSNRLYSEQKGQFKSKNYSCTFKPQLNKQSIILAQKNRKLLLEEASKVMKVHPQLNKTLPQNGVITHAQFLILNKKMRDIEVETQRNASIENTMRQCTFKPKITNKGLSLRRKSTLIESLTKLNNDQIVEHNKNYQSQKIPTLQPEKQPLKKNKPCLILDINFGGKEDQIILKPEDIYRLPEIAKHYADKYYIDQESEIQLLQMLADEFNIILNSGLSQTPN